MGLDTAPRRRAPRPPRMEALRELWTGAGLEAVETREITVQRTFADFDDFWTTSTRDRLHQADAGRDVRRRSSDGEKIACAEAAGRCVRPHHLWRTRQRREGSRGALILLEPGALDDFLPQRHLAHHARMQLLGPFVFHQETGRLSIFALTSGFCRMARVSSASRLMIGCRRAGRRQQHLRRLDHRIRECRLPPWSARRADRPNARCRSAPAPSARRSGCGRPGRRC